MSTDRRLRFGHRFKSGALCEIAVDLDAVRAYSFRPHFIWNGHSHKPREFITWAKEIFRIVSARAGTRVVYVYSYRNGESESWIFEPNQRPQRMPKKYEPSVNPASALLVTLYAQRAKESNKEGTE